MEIVTFLIALVATFNGLVRNRLANCPGIKIVGKNNRKRSREKGVKEYSEYSEEEIEEKEEG